MDPSDPQASELPSSEDNASSLCAECQRLDLGNIFSQAPVPSTAFAERLGQRKFIQKPRCKLCRAFWEVRSDRSHDEFDIWTGSFLALSSEVQSPRHRRAIYNDLDGVCIVVVPSGHDHEVQRAEEGWLPYLTRDFSKRKSEKLKYRVRAITPRPDYILISSWLAECRNHHSQCESHGLMAASDGALHGFRVIDVRTETIESYQTGQCYVTLSYVWGNAAVDRLAGWISAPGVQLPQDLPKTIKDAIEVVRALGHRYLWIDQYCISQYDEKHKTSQISIMGQIYSGSELTIVAAAGEDCEYGLPGVGERLRDCQRYQDDFNGVELLASPARPERLIQASKYATRGWTFQEGFLARRRLVFTDEQVYFECRQIYSFESLDRPIPRIYSNATDGQPANGPSIRRGYFEAACWHSPTWITFHTNNKRAELMGHFRLYLERNLKYQSDLWNAFRCVQDQYFPSIYGLPLFNLSFRSNTREQTHREIARSLSWTNRRWAESVRRPDFPSFTWSGWTGIPFFEQVEFVEQDIKFLNIDDWRPGDPEPSCLEIEVTTVVLNVRLSKQGGQLSLVRPAASVVAHRKGNLDMIHVPQILQLGSETIDRVYEVKCARLFTSEVGQCFLAIKRTDDWSERIGLLDLDKHDLPDLQFQKEQLILR